MIKILFFTSSLIFTLFLDLTAQNGNINSPGNTPPIQGENYQAFATNGAWVWFTDPRAVYHEGEHRRTYAGWVTSNGDIVVGAYDHDTKKIQTHIIYPELEVDDHDNPSLLISKKGHILAFYARHARETPMILSRSKKPENITSWEDPQLLDINDTVKYKGYSDTYTYSNPFYLSEEDKTYLFWRGSDFKPNFSVSSDWGESWTKSRIFILPDRKYPNRRPYVKYASNNRNRINFAFTDGHPHNEPHNSIYYMHYEDGAFYQANGNKIKNIDEGPVKPRETDVVFDARIKGNSKTWTWDVATDDQNHPVITYAKFPTDTTHIYCYARWDGREWKNYELVDAGKWFPQTQEGKTETQPNYSGGIVIDQENPNIVYLSVERSGVFEIEKWTTRDGGKTWQKEKLTQNSENDNVRPVAVRGAGKGNPLQVLWMNNERYVKYVDYKTSIRMGLQSSN